MRLQKLHASCLIGVLWLWSVGLPITGAYAQNALPTPDQLDQLLAPIALYPDQLVAQICTASTDPQQILDIDNWLHQNQGLSGQALTNAAQAQGFDPAFIALVNFPQVLDSMAQYIDDYAAIGQAFAADQGMVMDSVQRLRQQAYAAGALESNQYQTISVQPQGATQIVVIQPANPQVVYVPQYNPQVIFAQPSTAEVVTSSLLTFGAGIALGAWISNNSYPWGWGGWGWNWGHRNVVVHNNYWVVNNNRYRPRYPSYHYRPPVYNRPVYARPPNNWHDRPYFRPPNNAGNRPPGNNPGYRPPPPPNSGGNRPPSGGNNAGYRPPPGGNPPPPNSGGNRPPSGGNNPGYRPPPNSGGNRPTTNSGGNRPTNPTPPRPTPMPAPRPTQPQTRPAAPQYKPNQNAGYAKGPSGSSSGGRTSAFGGGNNAAADRAAINRGKASVSSQQRQGGGGKKPR